MPVIFSQFFKYLHHFLIVLACVHFVEDVGDLAFRVNDERLALSSQAYNAKDIISFSNFFIMITQQVEWQIVRRFEFILSLDTIRAYTKDHNVRLFGFTFFIWENDTYL